MWGHLAVGKFSSSGSAYPELFVCCVFVAASLLHPASPDFWAVVALYCFPWAKVPNPCDFVLGNDGQCWTEFCVFPLWVSHVLFFHPTPLSLKGLCHGNLPFFRGGLEAHPPQEHRIQQAAGSRGTPSSPCPWSPGAQCAPPTQSPPAQLSGGTLLCWDQPAGPFSMTG